MPPTIHARYTSLAEPAACIISAGTRKIPLPMTTPMTIEAAWAAPSSRTRPGAAVLFSTVEGMTQEYSVFPRSEPLGEGCHCGRGTFRVNKAGQQGRDKSVCIRTAKEKLNRGRKFRQSYRPC